MMCDPHPAGLPIGPGWVCAPDAQEITLPCDGSMVAQAPVGNPELARLAVCGARAVAREVSALPSWVRRDILLSVHRALAVNYEKLFRLDGKRAVVLGAGSGIGRESARALAAQGAEVISADRDLAAAEETGGQAYEIDLLEPGAAGRAAAALGALDIVVLTAATNVRKRLLDYDRAEFDRVVALNLGATFDVVRAFGAGMVERGRGSIIAFSSIRGTTVEPGQGPYAATKAGLVQLLRTAAAEFGPAGVRVNAIAGGNTAHRADQGRPGLVRGLRWQERAGPLGPAGGAGRCGRLSGLGCRELRHRLGARRRRGLDSCGRPLHAAGMREECP
jgi:NAD(P)-dependent dehydrogenase (short-subunit alcohol dehydrogenase family)